MERLVLYLCGLWFWITRKDRSTQYLHVAQCLSSAELYLSDDFNTRASTLDRGFLLPQHVEALSILQRQHAAAREASTRFNSLSECVRVVTEELLGPPKAA